MPPPPGSPAFGPVSLAFVQQAWAMWSTPQPSSRYPPAAAPPLAQAKSGLPFDTTVLVYVHGFRKDYERCLSVTQHLEQCIGDLTVSRLGVGSASTAVSEAEPEPELELERGGRCGGHASEQRRRFVVLGFVWPAHASQTSYGRARAKTPHAGALLARLLRQLSGPQRNRVVVVAHSLGARVVLEALSQCSSQLEASLAEARPTEVVSETVLLAASVANDVLQPGGEFDRSRLRTQRLVVCHSQGDPVLKSFFRTVEASAATNNWTAAGLFAKYAWSSAATQPALGWAGPTARTTGVRELAAQDVTAHGARDWLANAEVRSTIANAVLQ